MSLTALSEPQWWYYSTCKTFACDFIRIFITYQLSIKLLLPGDVQIDTATINQFTEILNYNLFLLCPFFVRMVANYVAFSTCNNVVNKWDTHPAFQNKHTHTHAPGHGWLGGCSRCRGKSFAQGRGSDRSQNPYRSVHHCTAPEREGKGRQTKLSKYRKRSVKAQKTSQLKHLKFSVGRGWLESKSCMSNCPHNVFMDN